MDYNKIINFLYTQLPMYQREGKAAYKANLDNTIALDAYFNSPHLNFKSIHIAGTNGKGSVSHFLAAILQLSGYKVGLYTSPHLKDYRERIKINGAKIPKNKVVEFIDGNIEFFKSIKPSFFEISVAMAFWYFSVEKIDIAIIETGLGGRLDSTNIITPLLSVITNISLDHCQFLGDTIEQIAAEKAGIIKQQIPVVIGENQNKTRKTFEDKAKSTNALIYFTQDNYSSKLSQNANLEIHKELVKGVEHIKFDIYKNNELLIKNVESELNGNYQQKNICTVFQVFEILKNKCNISISQSNILNGIRQVSKITGLQGRWQLLSNTPLTICDIAHNEAGLREILKQINNLNFNKLHFVFGLVNDKNINKILDLMPKNFNRTDKIMYYFTKANIPRAMDENELGKKASNFGLIGEVYSNVLLAYETAKYNSKSNDLIFIGGSTFVVAEIL